MVIQLLRSLPQPFFRGHFKATFRICYQERFLQGEYSPEVVRQTSLREVQANVCHSILQQYAFVLYQPYATATHQCNVKSVISYMPHALLQDRIRYGVEFSYEMPKPLANVIVDLVMWR